MPHLPMVCAHAEPASTRDVVIASAAMDRFMSPPNVVCAPAKTPGLPGQYARPFRNRIAAAANHPRSPEMTG